MTKEEAISAAFVFPDIPVIVFVFIIVVSTQHGQYELTWKSNYNLTEWTMSYRPLSIFLSGGKATRVVSIFQHSSSSARFIIAMRDVANTAIVSQNNTLHSPVYSLQSRLCKCAYFAFSLLLGFLFVCFVFFWHFKIWLKIHRINMLWIHSTNKHTIWFC